MAGRASRIYNFCHANPSASGCPFPSYLGNPAKVCDDSPFEIGTSAGCGVYNVYWIRDEYVEADVNIPDWKKGVTSTDASGNTYNLVAPLYSGTYSASGPRNQIGYFKLITTQFRYSTGSELLNTDNYSFYWINGSQIVASMDSTYDYIGTGSNPFFLNNSYHYFNSTTSAYQLLNKSVSVQLYAGAVERQCKLTIKNI